MTSSEWLELFQLWITVQQFKHCAGFADFLSLVEKSGWTKKTVSELLDRHCPRKATTAQKLGKPQWKIGQVVELLNHYVRQRDNLSGPDELTRLELFLQENAEAFLRGEFSSQAPVAPIKPGDVVQVPRMDNVYAVVRHVADGEALVETYFGEYGYFPSDQLIPGEIELEGFDHPPPQATATVPAEVVEQIRQAIRQQDDGKDVLFAWPVPVTGRPLLLVRSGDPDNYVTALLQTEQGALLPTFSVRRTPYGYYRFHRDGKDVFSFELVRESH